MSNYEDSKSRGQVFQLTPTMGQVGTYTGVHVEWNNWNNYVCLETYYEFKNKVMANDFRLRLNIDKSNSFDLNSLLIRSKNLAPNIKTEVYSHAHY